MKIRADFDISFDNVKSAKGYVIFELAPDYEEEEFVGWGFKLVEVVLSNCKAKGRINFQKLEEVAIKESKLDWN